MKQSYPTTNQANLMFLLISIAILLGSSLLIPRLGIGINLWINEYIWILAPAILLVKLGKMPAKQVFKLQQTSRRNIILGILSAIGMWFFTFYLSKMTGIFLNTKFGALDTSAIGKNITLNQSMLLLIGMVVLAPICEELLFRGFIQSAYEVHNKKYGFVMSAILFGMFHVLNGITEVIPTFIIGLMLGYLVYRTGSIASSIFAHMAFNASSIFINGAMGLSFLETIPLWLHFICIVGFIIALVLLSRLQPADAKEEIDEAPLAVKYSVGSIILFALSSVFVVCIVVVELYVRR